MSENINIEEMVRKAGSKYVLASVIGTRAKQINRGAKILTDDVSGKPITIAFREFAQDKIQYVLPQDADRVTEDEETVIPELPDAAPEAEEIPVSLGDDEDEETIVPKEIKKKAKAAVLEDEDEELEEEEEESDLDEVSLEDIEE